jgi:mannose-6-phosphate isomerase-like protein (cupin superfamily)
VIYLVRRVIHEGRLLSIIVPKDFSQPGIHFVTPYEFSQQLAFLNHPSGTKIQPHVHHMVHREVKYIQEVLFIKKGKVRVDFYNEEQTYLESVMLTAGDTILLAAGGHGFEMLEDTEIIEVKQGPYAEYKDKTRFSGISSGQIILRDDL